MNELAFTLWQKRTGRETVGASCASGRVGNSATAVRQTKDGCLVEGARTTKAKRATIEYSPSLASQATVATTVS